jgi:hypothetical protein
VNGLAIGSTSGPRELGKGKLGHRRCCQADEGSRRAGLKGSNGLGQEQFELESQRCFRNALLIYGYQVRTKFD